MVFITGIVLWHFDSYRSGSFVETMTDFYIIVSSFSGLFKKIDTTCRLLSPIYEVF